MVAVVIVYAMMTVIARHTVAVVPIV
jgi:hypothetical protein